MAWRLVMMIIVLRGDRNGVEAHDNNDSPSELAKLSELEMKTVENLEQQRMELQEENEKLMVLCSSYLPLVQKFQWRKSVPCLLNVEQAFVDFDGVLREIAATEEGLQQKQEEFRSLELLSSEMQDKKALVDKKLSALRYSLSNFSSSVAYFEQREVRAKARVNASVSYFRKKKEELARLQVCKEDAEANLRRIQKSEIELRSILEVLKSKIEEKNQRQETEKVLFAIDNIEKVDNTSQRNWQVCGKASELLKYEEEKNKLQSEMKLSREKACFYKKRIRGLE
ncbi:KINESIN FAMILY MEMBER 1A [Salix koriyanagi]|uniref:KINESIN FAMILY MEMBER 1A n=1 Tax=Salix koriyanagi TaxID=2511006 RepID=A0A9Q0Z0V5_9ROSI|nr:KINESIN FAMILY MEMBER 1A [Salix koriyanagi]